MPRIEPQNELTLYRKYRPRTFAEVVGQEHVLRVLTRACTEKKVAHAYLFAGYRGTGKTTVARLLAKRLNCERAKGTEPCTKCSSCLAVAAGAHLDLIEIDAASNRGIDDIRNLKDRIRLQPIHGHWKVYIVDEVHMLTKEAFNALLKTLEEPPPHAIFILATTELEKVPDTVRSRCQTFVFRRAPMALIVSRLQKIARAEGLSVDDAALRLLAVASEGCFRDAESLLALVAGSASETISAEDASALLGLTPLATIQDFIDALLRRTAASALSILRDVSARGGSFVLFTEELARYLRALASAAAAGTHQEDFSHDEAERFAQQLAAVPLPDLVSLLRFVLRTKYELRDAVYEELPLELLILEWCGGKAAGSAPEQVRYGAGSGQSAVENTATAARPAPDGSHKDSGAAQEPAAPGGSHATGAPASTQKKARVAAGDAAQEIPIDPQQRESKSDRAMRSDGGSLPRQDPPKQTDQSVELILDRWPAFLRAAAPLHPLLLPMLHDTVPLAVRDGTLYALNDHALAHDRFKDPSFRHPVEERLEEACGVRLRLRLVRQRELPGLDLEELSPELRARLRAAVTQETAPAPALAETISIFGGEVVDKGTATS